ncbi:LysM peptidoglycan-binding domain-containing protein [Ruania alba]|uniref:Uncharacterized protein n=1 Tax=Ruania alba TaxID=648782 RepID=A0A1H5NCA1_9MICO|nr:LysM domain-containing protein [Ruania alba]SEE99144.1 hypothetical protein SAMN04488554_4181 [Ruania alba]
MSTGSRLAIGACTAAGSGAITLALGVVAITEFATPPEAVRIDDLLTAAAAAVGALVACWYAISALVGVVCVLVRHAGGLWAAGERAISRRGAPGMARLVSAGTSAVLAAGFFAAPAQAAAPAPDPVTAAAAPARAVPPDDLGWGAAPASDAEGANREGGSDGTSSPSGREAPHRQSPADDEPDPPRDQDSPYEVLPGDSLWSIAAAHLPDDASDIQIAETWPRWYAANADAIGTDPHLIQPGTQLHAPTPEEVDQ